MCLLLSSSESFLWPDTDGCESTWLEHGQPFSMAIAAASAARERWELPASSFIALLMRSPGVCRVLTSNRCFWGVVTCSVQSSSVHWALLEKCSLSCQPTKLCGWCLWCVLFWCVLLFCSPSESVAHVTSCSSAFLLLIEKHEIH